MGVLLGLAQRPGVWILWVGSSAIYLVIYAQVALWGQVGLMGVFIALSFWGLWRWRSQSQAQETQKAVSKFKGTIFLHIWYCFGSFNNFSIFSFTSIIENQIRLG